MALPGPWRQRESGRGEVSVPHWPGSGYQAAITAHMHSTPARSHSRAPRTMRLSLPLLMLLLGAWAIPGSLSERAPLTATAPQLDDEEKYSAHMPAHLRCDACRAVTYQVSPTPAVPLPLARPLHLPQIPPLAFDPQPLSQGIKPDSAFQDVAIFTSPKPLRFSSPICLPTRQQ